MRDHIKDEVVPDDTVPDDAFQTAVPGLRGPVRLLQRDAARYWWLPMVTGNVWILIAGLVLRTHPTSATGVGQLVGAALAVAAITEAAHARLVSGRWRALQTALAVFFGLGAVFALARPIDALHAVTSNMGLLLLMQGAFYVVRAVALRKQTRYWSIGLISGTLLVQLGLWIPVTDGMNLTGPTVFVLAWLGLSAVFHGISDMTLALGLHRPATTTRARESGSAGVGPAANGPAQRHRSVLEAKSDDERAPSA